MSRYRVLIAGLLSPFAAPVLYTLVYGTLTEHSPDPQKDWLFRLSMGTLAMLVPFLVTLALFLKDRSRPPVSLSAKIGFGLALLSLGLAWSPVHDAIIRSKQVRNLALHDVAAPAFSTVDIAGKPVRLADHKGEVVLVNIWATWCGPCRAEMPKLDRLYQTRKAQGFVVFGLSDEDVPVQQKFVTQVPVTYPLLTVHGEIPGLYRDIVKYPAIFLIDRQGRLQPAPSPEEPFERVEAAVDALLGANH